MTLFPNLLPTRGPSALVSTRQQLVHRGAPTLCTLPEELGAIFSYPTSDYANGEI